MAVTDARTGPTSPEGLYRYNLSPEELRALEVEMLYGISDRIVEGELPVAVVSGQSRFANIGRSVELQVGHIRTMPKTMEEYEANSEFLFVLDPRGAENGSPIVRHVLRITRATQTFMDKGKTGLASVDDIVFNLGFAKYEDVLAKYGNGDQDSVPKFISIDSNATATPEDPAHYFYTVAGYKAIEQYCVDNGIRFIFAEFNGSTTSSLIGAGVEFGPFMDNPNLELPNQDEINDGSPHTYKPYIIPVSQHNISLFQDPTFSDRPDVDIKHRDQAKFLAQMPVQMIYNTHL